jgi:hypothetical protein
MILSLIELSQQIVVVPLSIHIFNFAQAGKVVKTTEGFFWVLEVPLLKVQLYLTVYGAGTVAGPEVANIKVEAFLVKKILRNSEHLGAFGAPNPI